MKILQINCVDTHGGASKLAHTLCKGLINRGHQVTYLVGKKTSDESFIQEQPEAGQHRLRNKVLHRLGTDFLNLHHKAPFHLGREFFQRFDLIQLHDAVHLNTAAIPWLSKIRPLLLTLHNMWFFTGNCFYSNGCGRWQTGCGKCPEFGKFPLHWLRRDASKLNLRLRKFLYARAQPFHVVGGSKWAARLASDSVLKHQTIHTIPSHADTEVYQPIPKSEAKRKLGIDPDIPAILFSVAANPDDARKGTAIIFEALRKLQTRQLTLIPLGITPGDERFAELLSDLPFPSLPPRHIADDAELNLHYSAADLLWHPSLADNSPLTILEAFASGTPAIATDVGGVSEFFTTRNPGTLIPPHDPAALANATDQLLADPQKLAELSREARTTVENEFSYELFLDRYESLYKKIAQ